jgi:MoaA/NifB/PqqE/SkfB family radical SAM enzyme
MSTLLQEMGGRALKLGVPFSVQVDLTYRCNEQCVHCYLDHEDHGEMTTTEIKHLLEEMAEAGVFILTFSGGEIFLRKDFFEILEYARSLTFCIKLKTNAVLIREAQAARLRDLGVQSVQISIYSHRPEVHDAITKVRGSLQRSIRAVRFLKSQGLRVILANVLMTENMQDYRGVRAHAEDGWRPLDSRFERRRVRVARALSR